jgi:glycosyltransferase involved in cell wall biosynthesis
MKVLPAMVASGITNTSSKKLRGVRRAANLPATLVWFGRLEILKDLHSLISFCHLRPEVLVVAYGPIEFTSDVQLPKNLQLRGTVNSIENIDLDEFDAFLFTSKFEGMPNVVLEMAEREIPIIAASVGGIVETFGTESIFLYSNADDSSETARRISLTLNDLQSLNDSQIADRVKRAREILMIKHSHSHYKDRVVEIFLKSGAE